MVVSKREQKDDNSIRAVQGLRALACLMIIISHCGFFLYLGNKKLHEHMVAGGPAGVSIFIILSGCLIGLKYVYSEKRYQIRSHIFKLYPLHIITMVAMALYLYKYGNLLSHPLKLEYFITNIFLIQSFIPDPNCYFSLNAVAWYLSLNAFLCLITPIAVWAVKKLKSYSDYALGFIFLAIMINMFMYKNDPLMHFYIYINPFSRVLEFIAGAFLACFIKEKSEHIIKKNYQWQLVEILAYISLIIGYVFYTHLPTYFTYRLMFFPVALILVFVAVTNKGIIARLVLGNRISVYLGNISGAAFLVQLVVIHIVEIKTNVNAKPILSFIFVITLCIALSSVYYFTANHFSRVLHQRANKHVVER